VGRIATRSQMTADEYLVWERAQPEKHEFFRGEVFAMAGGSPRHNAVCSRVNRALGNLLEARGCVVLTSDQRVSVGDGERYVYPDVSVVCGPLDIQKHDVLANPTMIVEVLSTTTEPYDRGLKWEGYQRLGSLQDYVLVSQSEPRVEHYQRAPDGSWIYRAAGPREHVKLSTGVSIPVDEIFAGVFELPGD
jgi:Uma2 family endonuclease